MKKYAYLDKYGILHISADRETAREYSRTGKIVETEIRASHGYPVSAGEEVIVYSETEMKTDPNGPLLDAGDYPELAELYQKCR